MKAPRPSLPGQRATKSNLVSKVIRVKLKFGRVLPQVLELVRKVKMTSAGVRDGKTTATRSGAFTTSRTVGDRCPCVVGSIGRQGSDGRDLRSKPLSIASGLLREALSGLEAKGKTVG